MFPSTRKNYECCLCVYIYIYIYIYIHTHTHTHIYVHIYTHKFKDIHTYIYIYIYTHTQIGVPVNGGIPSATCAHRSFMCSLVLGNGFPVSEFLIFNILRNSCMYFNMRCGFENCVILRIAMGWLRLLGSLKL